VYMQTIILSTLGTTLGISSILSSISTLSSSIFSLVGQIKLTKNIHQNEILQVLTKADIEATIILLESIIIEVSQKETFVNNKFILIALQHVKQSIVEIEAELKIIKERITYNSTLYVMSNLRSYDLLKNLNIVEAKILVLDRRCEYFFKSLELAKHFSQ
jgi:hypothetical protein